MADEIWPADPVVVRGGGDLATGIVWRLTRSGWPVLVTELAAPLTVRRTVSLSTAVHSGQISVEGMIGQHCELENAPGVSARGLVPVVVCPVLSNLYNLTPGAVVDARMAKRNIDTIIEDAPAVIGVGPGFTVGVDCHAIVETQRGHDLGRVLWEGSARPNTGTPGRVAGWGRERVLRAPADGIVAWQVAIGDRVAADQLIGTVSGKPVRAPFDGVVRGLIIECSVPANLKIGDIDPRNDPAMCQRISDKALAVGGAAVEALAVLEQRSRQATEQLKPDDGRAD